MRTYKNTQFKEGFNPSFSQFEKSYKEIFDPSEMEEAYEAATGKKAPSKELKPKKGKQSEEDSNQV